MRISFRHAGAVRGLDSRRSAWALIDMRQRRLLIAMLRDVGRRLCELRVNQFVHAVEGKPVFEVSLGDGSEWMLVDGNVADEPVAIVIRNSNRRSKQGIASRRSFAIVRAAAA
jgi:hypothetical protein